MAETILTSETSVRKPGLSKCFRSVDQNYIVHVIVKENIEEATIQTVNNTTIIVLFLVFLPFSGMSPEPKTRQQEFLRSPRFVSSAECTLLETAGQEK